MIKLYPFYGIVNGKQRMESLGVEFHFWRKGIRFEFQWRSFQDGKLFLNFYTTRW